MVFVSGADTSFLVSREKQMEITREGLSIASGRE